VAHHAHAILPDGTSAYDGGDWSNKPARMPAGALWALAALLPVGTPERAESLFLARGLRERGTFEREKAWLGAFAGDPNAHPIDPRAGVASASFAGTGLTLARSAWAPEAVFVTLQAGPTLAPDHQHSDQGHVSIARGGDWLLVDSGMYGAASTMSHNT